MRRSAVAVCSVLCLLVAQPLMAGAAASAAGDAEWVQVGSYTPPFIRMNAAMAFDSNSGETLLFGGNVPSNVNGNGLMGDTWTFDGSRWTEHQPAPSPSLRTGARAVWDATRGQVVLFGGAGTGGVLSDTWTWDGNTWTERHPAHSPAARAFGGMAYDAATSKVVLVGGTDGNNVSLPDTWTWDGTDWTQEITALSPPPRASFGFADGSATSPPVLFGGVNFAGVQGLYLNDTWTWDGPNHTWVPHPVATSPVPRAGLQLAYDPAIGKTVLYGGYAFAPNVQPNGFSTQGNYDDTWTWDGSGWTLLGSAGPPRQRFYGAMAYDPVNTRMHLFGGAVWGKGYLDDIWSFDGAKWSVEDQNAPNELQNAMLARETPRSGTAILFGGQNEYGRYNQDTWRWDETGWRLLSPAHSPPPRGMAAMTFDPSTGTTLLFGGNVDTLDFPGPRQIYDAADTWTWDGTDWTEQHPATSPPARDHATMVYDEARGEVVLFGGAASGFAKGDTWTWDGTTWTEEHPVSSPPERFAAAMTYDPINQEVVLFGGSMSKSEGWYEDTWTWDGTNWTEETPATIPPPAAYATMAYDPRSESSILFGGCQNCYGLAYGETWAWDGVDWTVHEPAKAPFARTNVTTLSGDTWVEGGVVRSRPMMLFGGRRPVLKPSGALASYDEGTGFTADLWAFNAPELPGGQFHVYGPGR